MFLGWACLPEMSSRQNRTDPHPKAGGLAYHAPAPRLAPTQARL